MLDLSGIPVHQRDPVSSLFFRLRENLTTGVFLRGHSKDIDEEIKNIITGFSEKEISSSDIFFRARLNPYTSDAPLRPNEMGAPPCASRGRVQYEGVSVLYAADSKDTAISEIKPHLGATVSVGKFSCDTGLRLRLLDLSSPAINPSAKSFAEYDADARNYLFSLIFSERGFSRAVHPEDPDRYLETIYIAKIIRDLGYDGVIYKSLQNKCGKNYAYFKSDDFICNEVGVVKIAGIRVEFIEDSSRF